PHLHLVLLRFEPAEEPENARELLVALEHLPALRLVETRPGTIDRDASPPREAPQVGLLAAVVRLAPGLDRPVGEALLLVGHDEIEVHLDEVPEPVAARAGPERVVEGEESRLGLEEGPRAARALEALGEAQRRAVLDDRHRLPGSL